MLMTLFVWYFLSLPLAVMDFIYGPQVASFEQRESTPEEIAEDADLFVKSLPIPQ